MKHKILLSLMVLLPLLMGCKDHYNFAEEDVDRGELVGITHLKSLSLDRVKEIVGDSIEQQFLQYGVRAYKIEYATDYMNLERKVKTTGLLLVPQYCEEVKLLTYLHGTNMPIQSFGMDANLPSHYNFDNIKASSEVTMMGIPFAAAGYTVFMPDYIGYAETSVLEHPFVFYPELDKEIIDGLLATRWWMIQQGYLSIYEPTPLWITGWSQGGGAALSTMRELQEDYTGYFDVQSTSALSGPYDFTHFLTSVLEHPDSTYLLVNLYIWAGYAVNYFRVQRPNDQIFTSPITDETAAILGAWGKPGEIFRPIFIDGVLTGRDTAFLNACNENSTARGWKPEAPVYLHHGTDDWVVLPFNSDSAYAGLTREGADVTLYKHKGYSHFNCCYKYTNTTLHDWLDKK